jgi:TatD DNase family protein
MRQAAQAPAATDNNQMQLIDTHAHLDMLKDPKAALDKARKAGVVQMIAVGIDLASSKRAAGFARDNDDVFYTVGLHPHDAEATSPGLWPQLSRLASEGAVAWGECGLDYFRDYAPHDIQQESFHIQIDLAKDAGLPLVIHSRAAHDDSMAILLEHRAQETGGVFHCFGGDENDARRVLDMGFLISIPGTITFPKNQQLRDLVKLVPLDMLIIETDCPFLAPVPKRGKENQPAYVAHTLNTLAQCLGITAEKAAEATTANARRLFGLPVV